MKKLTVWPLVVLLSHGCSAIAAQKDQSKLMSLAEAREYMLGLVNRDRVANHLSTLTIDPTATAAGQMHSNEMAQKGYISHWDTAGRKPTQRYTEAGGSDSVSENLCLISTKVFSTEKKSDSLPSLHKPSHLFSTIELNNLQKTFMDETPPDDGHRAQILMHEHNKVGFGLSFSANDQNEGQLALAQEFLNNYGKYSKLPLKIVRGHSFEVSGSFTTGVKLYSVSVYWEQKPKPLSKEELNNGPRQLTYSDESIITFFPTDKSKVKTSVFNGSQRFSVILTPAKDWKSGLYYISICAMEPKRKDLIEVSSRTTFLD